MLLEIQIPYDASNNPLNNTEWAFPLLEIIHIIGFAVAIGTIFIQDLRLMGLGMRKQTSSELRKDLSTWTLAGFAAVLISGPLIWSSDPNMYLNNPSFLFKMAALTVALIYHYTVHRKVTMADASGSGAALVGIVSVTLWVSIIASAIFIAFV